jgi:hypothetical protein
VQRSTVAGSNTCRPMRPISENLQTETVMGAPPLAKWLIAIPL